MSTKAEFIEALDGTELKIKQAFVAGYNAGVSDGQADMSNNFENEYRWWKGRQEKQKEKERKKWKISS